MNWTERLAKIWNLGNVKLQTRNCKLRFAVFHEKPDAKGPYLLMTHQSTQNPWKKTSVSNPHPLGNCLLLVLPSPPLGISVALRGENEYFLQLHK